MAAPADMEPITTADETTTESEQLSRLKRYDPTGRGVAHIA